MSTKTKTTKTPIAVMIFEDAETWLRENVEYMWVDSVCAVYPKEDINLDGETEMVDVEETDGEDENGEPKPLSKKVKMEDWVRGLQQLCEQVGKTLWVGCLRGPYQLTDFGNWDVEVTDAYFQLVFRGEVIYG
jgi:hypothetical protein